MYRLPAPPDAAAVVAEAGERERAGRRAEAVELLMHAVHAGTDPGEIFAAALALGAELEGRRRDRAEALAAKQAKVAG